MSGHTPGPWTFEARHHYQFGVHAHVIPRGGMHRRICLTNSPRTYQNKELDAENEANARLIAAAPDLLEALKGLLDETLDALGAIDQLAPDYDRLIDQPVIKKAMAALAKAEREVGGEHQPKDTTSNDARPVGNE